MTAKAKTTEAKTKQAKRPEATAGQGKRERADAYTPRLKERYRAELQGRLKEQLGLENVMQVPKPEKVIVNMGVGDAARDAKQIGRAHV